MPRQHRTASYSQRRCHCCRWARCAFCALAAAPATPPDHPSQQNLSCWMLSGACLPSSSWPGPSAARHWPPRCPGQASGGCCRRHHAGGRHWRLHLASCCQPNDLQRHCCCCLRCERPALHVRRPIATLSRLQQTAGAGWPCGACPAQLGTAPNRRVGQTAHSWLDWSPLLAELGAEQPAGHGGETLSRCPACPTPLPRSAR